MASFMATQVLTLVEGLPKLLADRLIMRHVTLKALEENIDLATVLASYRHVS